MLVFFSFWKHPGALRSHLIFLDKTIGLLLCRTVIYLRSYTWVLCLFFILPSACRKLSPSTLSTPHTLSHIAYHSPSSLNQLAQAGAMTPRVYGLPRTAGGQQLRIRWWALHIFKHAWSRSSSPTKALLPNQEKPSSLFLGGVFSVFFLLLFL